MKIAHVIDSLDPSYGGPPVVAFRLVAGLKTLGHDASLISSTEVPSYNRVRASIRGVTNAAAVPLPIVAPARETLPAISRIRNRKATRDLRALLEGVDVAHFHAVWRGLTMLGSQLCREMGVPYVIQPHGLLDPWSLRQRAAKKRLVLALGARRMLNEAGGLLLLNDDELTGLAGLGLTTPLMRVIPNGIDLAELYPLPSRGAFRAAHPLLGDRPYVLFLSRLHQKKGLDHLADAFAIVAAARPDAMLVVVGPDDGERAPFEARAARLGVAARTLVVGPLYGKTKVEAMVDADAFCLPSRQEGFSVAILEALACGCPAVISQACHFPEVAAQGAGFVVPLEPPAIAEALLRLLNDQRLARGMGEAGQAMVVDRYTWTAACTQAVNFYEAILERQRSPAAR